MANSEKTAQVEPPPYTQQPPNTAQPGFQPQPGYPAQPGYQPQPGYVAPPAGYQAQPGYVAPPAGYQPQPGYPAQPGYQAQPGYPPQYGYPPPQPVQQVQQSTTVVNVGMPATQTIIVQPDPRPQNYLGLSICTCLFCTWPIGLAAIVFSCMADSAYNAGDRDGALRNATIAKWLNVASILCGIIIIIVIATSV